MDGSCYRLLVTGPSGSGKTTLSSLLSTSLRCAGWDVRLVQQDSFFSTERAPSYWGQENKDSNGNRIKPTLPDQCYPAASITPDRIPRAAAPAAVNMPAFLTAIKEASQGVKVGWGQSPTLLLVEGFLLLQEPAIVAGADAVIFVSAPGEVCLSRRLNRSHRSAHENEGCKHYWHEYVWPSFLSITRPALLQLLATAPPSEDAPPTSEDSWPPPPALYFSTSPTLVLNGEASLDAVLLRTLDAFPTLFDLNSPYDWMGGVAADAVEVAAKEYAALCVALHAASWSELGALLPALVAVNDPKSRARVGLALVPLFTVALRKALVACGDAFDWKGALVGSDAPTSGLAVAEAVHPASVADSGTTAVAIPEGRPPAKLPPPLCEPIILICRMLNNARTEEPAVQAALSSHGAPALLRRLLDVGCDDPTEEGADTSASAAIRALLTACTEE